MRAYVGMSIRDLAWGVAGWSSRGQPSIRLDFCCRIFLEFIHYAKSLVSNPIGSNLWFNFVVCL